MSAGLSGGVWRCVAVVLQELMGLLFVVSAGAKLLGIDDFEIYLYSFGLVALPVAMVGARVVVAVELVLGVALMAGVAPRRTAQMLLLLTVVFTMALGYALLVGRSDNCHCFGALAQVDVVWSMVKNAVIIVLLVVLLKSGAMWQWSVSWLWIAAVSVALTVGVFVVSMPDNWMFGASEEAVDEPLLRSAVEGDEALTAAQPFGGRKVVVMASAGCRYCHKALQKLATIADRHQIDTSLFVVIMPRQETMRQWDDGVAELQSERYYINAATFLHITHGQRPIVLLMDEGRIAHSYHYRNINEEEIAEFLSL